MSVLPLLLVSLASAGKPAPGPLGPDLPHALAASLEDRLASRTQFPTQRPCDAAPGETVLFCDEFDEPALSHADDARPIVVDGQDTIWFSHSGAWSSRAYIHGCELQYYTVYGLDYSTDGPTHYANPGHQGNFVQRSDSLSLVLREEPGTTGYIPGWMGEPGDGCWMSWQQAGDHSTQQFDYTSGWLQTAEQFRYGRFEIRAKIPNEGRVAWPAFWLFGGTAFDGDGGGHGEQANEIDIFEFTGYEPHRFTRNLHTYYRYSDYLAMYGDPGDDPALEECTADHWSPTCNFRRDPATDSMTVHHGYHEDLSVDVGDWHTYAVEWSPRGLVWFMDGQPIGPSVHHDIPDNFMTLIVNLALPDWLGHGIDQGVVDGNDTSLTMPADFEIDYVKVSALPDPELTKDWSNAGTDRIDGWYLNANDHHAAGDFDGDGRHELFSMNATSGWAKLMDHHPRQVDESDWEWTWDNPTWTTAWANDGGGSVDWWALSDTDRFLVGDFVRDAEGADELLGLQASSGYAHLMRYDGDWSTRWANAGSGSIHWWVLNPDDHYVVGNFDGAGPDEVLALREASGHAHLMRYGRTGWTTPWATDEGQVASWIFHGDDHYVAADVDADGADEIVAFNAGTGWAQLLEYQGGQWVTTWHNDGEGAVKWWLMDHRDVYRAGDFADAPGDEVLAYSPRSGWVQILRFDGTTFQHAWGNDGHGRRHDPSTLLVGDFAGQGTQLLSIAARHHAYLESYRLPSEVLDAD